MNLILSSCGTSILTNKVDKDTDLSRLLTKHANVQNSDAIPLPERTRIHEHIESRKKEFSNYSCEDAKHYSAELNGIISFYGGQLSPEKLKDHHYLLATDTWFAEETAGIVEAWLRNHGFANIYIQRHEDLQTGDLQRFRRSLSDLVKWCAELIAPQRTPYLRIIFNLSGGFKSETGFLQMLGMFYADETIYMFERSNELMRIPRLPVRMENEESVRGDLRDFRRAALKLAVCAEKSGIYWRKSDSAYELTEWGVFVFTQHKDKIYQEAIHLSPSEKIVFAPSFLPSCAEETLLHKQAINEKIDLLARFLEDGEHPNPRSLHYHPVTHSKHRAVTHEIYAWSNDDAKRIYCRALDNGVVELLFLGDHL